MLAQAGAIRLAVEPFTTDQPCAGNDYKKSINQCAIVRCKNPQITDSPK